MCQGDVAVLTYEWRDGMLNPYPDFKMERECRKWDNIMEWTKARHVDINTDIIWPDGRNSDLS